MLEAPTYAAIFDRITPGLNKYMATVFNGSAGRVIKVHRVWCFNWQVAAVTGVLVEHELRRITARTGGTAVTPVPRDTNDILSAGVVVETASTGVTEAQLLRRFFGASEEMKLGALALENVMNDANGIGSLVYWAGPAPIKPVVLRPGQGITIKCITSTTVGTCSYVYEFTDELPPS